MPKYVKERKKEIELGIESSQGGSAEGVMPVMERRKRELEKKTKLIITQDE